MKFFVVKYNLESFIHKSVRYTRGVQYAEKDIPAEIRSKFEPWKPPKIETPPPPKAEKPETKGGKDRKREK